ncbi:MAG TPA: hypothetical protein VNF47_02220 [Streptosporangiaceae bacterium]|nr:hypothetical protein [Streptosporangiaceae bacterium]
MIFGYAQPYNSVNGLAAASPTEAWAVGSAATGQNLAEHWNGRAWTRVAVPSPGKSPVSVLNAVAAVSSAGTWAVGYSSYYGNHTRVKALIERWNGWAWKQVASPTPGGSQSSGLAAVAATGPSSAWAVGSSRCGTTFKTLIEHWNGRAWKQVASPSPGGSDNSFLFGVAADRSSSSAWAVGYYRSGTTDRTLIERWNGRAWTQVASPNPGGSYGSSLNAVAIAGSGAWAVGDFAGERALIERWNGRTWRQVAISKPGGSRGIILKAVTAAGPSDAWAVGYYFTDTRVEPAVKTLIEHWDGKAWKQVASPSPGGSVGSSGEQSLLDAVSAAPAPSSDAWAAGYYTPGSASVTPLIERWTRMGWRQVVP